MKQGRWRSPGAGRQILGLNGNGMVAWTFLGEYEVYVGAC